MTTIYKQYDLRNKLIAYKMWCRNDNRKTIEQVDVLVFAENGLNEEQIIELLHKNRVHLLTNREKMALQLRDDSSEQVTLTKREYEYAVKNGLTYNELLDLRKTIELLKQFKVKI